MLDLLNLIGDALSGGLSSGFLRLFVIEVQRAGAGKQGAEASQEGEAQGVEEKSVLEIQGACDHAAHTRCDGEPPGGFVDGTEPQPAAKGQHKENTQCCPTRG